MTASTIIEITSIRTDGGTQPRAELDAAAVADYSAAMAGGANFPPVVAYADGSTFWLADGFHRVAAAVAIGATTIAADVRPLSSVPTLAEVEP